MILVVPMAGRGQRLREYEPLLPKPLVMVEDVPIFHIALRSLEKIKFSKIIFIVLAEHERDFKISRTITDLNLPCIHILYLEKVSEGQLATVLAAKEFLDTDEPVLIGNADTLILSTIYKDIAHLNKNISGLISVIKASGDNWSFVKTDLDNIVIQVAEKERISELVSTGLYYFSSSREFVSYAEEMIQNNEKNKGEFYVIPVYSKYIKDGKKITVSFAETMYDLGSANGITVYKNRIGKS